MTDYLRKGPDVPRYTTLVNRIRNAIRRHRAGAVPERAPRRTEAQFELLAEIVQDYASFFLDESGYIETWNEGAEAVSGYASEEIVGEHVSILYRDDDVAAGLPDRNLRRAANEGRTRDEAWRVCRDGTEFWAEVTITAIRREDELVGYATVTRDSTKRHRERELLAQKEQLEELIAAISHDLRSPLTVAEGYVQLAEETGDPSNLEEAARALGQAGELLDYLSKLAEEGERIGERQPVDLQEVAEDAWSLVETEGAELNVEGSAVLVGDRQRLLQLLENLFENAVKHGSTSPPSQAHEDTVEQDARRTSARDARGDAVKHGAVGRRSKPAPAVDHDTPRSGRDIANDGAAARRSTHAPSQPRGDADAAESHGVTVSVGLLGGDGFYVEDDGPGVPEYERAEIFERGYSSDADGTGFGLAICRQIVDGHGWSIEVTDGSHGGARFEMTGVSQA